MGRERTFHKETWRIKLNIPQGVGLVSEFVDHIDYVRNCWD